jgi:phage terminase large subunit-like protein
MKKWSSTMAKNDDMQVVGINYINSKRAQMKRMHTDLQYDQKFNRIMHYKPYAFQRECHKSLARERGLIAANQVGKTNWGGNEMAIQALQLDVPYIGSLIQIPPLDRPHDFIGWYTGPGSQHVRDNGQLKLLGPIADDHGLGTGAIPLDFIQGFTLSRGISNFVDQITIRRMTKGTALLASRTYEQSARMWQGTPVDLLWYDEDPGFDATYLTEGQARTLATKGRTIYTLTPLMGLTPVVKRLTQGGPDIFLKRAGIKDAEHFTEEDVTRLYGSVTGADKLARLEGMIAQGQGAVFETPIEQIWHDLQWQDVPLHWPVIIGLDFNRSGSHPFCAVWMVRNPDTDELFVMDIMKMGSESPDLHVAKIKQHKLFDAPVAWPHDGSQVGDMRSGDTIAHIYKKCGLNLLPHHATMPEGGYSLTGTVTEMRRRIANGTLKFARHCRPYIELEYQNYHFADGKIQRQDDDALDATRVAMMSIRLARSQDDLMMRLGKNIDGNNAPQLRSFLTPLSEWAEQTDVTIFTLMHLNKHSLSKNPLNRIMGSQAVGAVTRSMFFCVAERDNDGNKTGRFLFLRAKNNLCPPGTHNLAYRLVGVDVPMADGSTYNHPKVVWDGQTALTADEAMSDEATKPKDKTGEAKMMLTAMLMDGKQVPRKDLIAAARERGFSESTLERAYRQLGGKGTKKKDYGGEVHWFLPKHARKQAESQAKLQDELGDMADAITKD